jgi:ornithine cyclodeaminase/alanine dehydrogenase-like protein (mu-crystallin family)
MYIPESEIRAALTYEALIPAIRRAMIDYSTGRVEQPARMILRAGNAEGDLNGWFAVMPVIHDDMMAVKTVTFYPGNAELGLHTHMATVELINRATGEPLAVLDGRLITEMRTAAVSAVALEALAPGLFPSDPLSLGILGSGVQARAHLRALRKVCPSLADIRVWSRNPEHAARLAAEAGASSVSREEAAGAQVVLTVTSSPAPVLEGRWLQPHALVLAVGATGSSLRELDDEAMQSSFVVAECRSAAERESGDVRSSGVRVRTEIGEILSGAQPAPRDTRVVFKSVGMAIEDLTAARLVWQARSAKLK